MARPITNLQQFKGRLQVLLLVVMTILLRERAGGASKFFPLFTLRVSAKTTTTPKTRGGTLKITHAKTNILNDH